MKLSAIPKPLLITGIVIAGVINLVIFTTVIIGVTTGSSSPTPTPTPVQTEPVVPTTPPPSPTPTPSPTEPVAPRGSVLYALHHLKVADPKPGGYDRDEFGQEWADVDRNGCDQRNDVLRRGMVNLHTVPAPMAVSWPKAF